MPGSAQFAILLAAALVAWGWIRIVRRASRAEQKAAELAAEVERLQSRLERVDAAKSEFIAITSHQLRAPLAVIREYARILLDGTLGPASGLARESLQKVLGASEQLLGIVTDFFELARIEGGRMAYASEHVAVDTLVDDIMREHEPVALAKGIALSFANRSAMRRATNADPAKLSEAISHLVDNALRYTAAGRVHIELTPEIIGNRGWLKLNVSDTGIGIRPTDIPDLFVKFGRTEEARSIRPDGLGLGLYTARRIVESHGGKIGAESPGLGHGSLFWVRLPATL